jgi:hypothetical protein
MRLGETVVLSSDSEPDAFDANHTRHSVASESANDDNDAYLDGSQSSQIHRSRNLIEQLQQDAVDDFRADLCFELDCLREPAKEDASENKTNSTDPLRDDDAVQGLRDVLRRWAEDERASRHTSHFYYRLDHKYDENQFPPPDGFCGRDLAVVEALDQVGGELDIEIFLALLDRDDNEPTPNYLVRSLVDQQGHELISYIPVGESNWVQTRLPSLNARAPDSEVVSFLLGQPRCRMMNAHLLSLGRGSYSPGHIGGLFDAVHRGSCDVPDFQLSDSKPRWVSRKTNRPNIGTGQPRASFPCLEGVV